jgi:hypothetical protein
MACGQGQLLVRWCRRRGDGGGAERLADQEEAGKRDIYREDGRVVAIFFCSLASGKAAAAALMGRVAG